MKKLSIILYVFVLAVVQYSCQEDEEFIQYPPVANVEPPEDDECGTAPFTQEELDFMNDPNGEFQKFGREFLQKAKIQKFRIPIRAHVLRRDNGSGGISEADIEASVARTNVHYRWLNMEFYVDEYHDLNNTTDYNIYLNSKVRSRPLENRLAKDHAVKEAINVFFVQNSNTSWVPASKGHILMNNWHTRNESTFAHELGHFFGLPHTHTKGDELVDGSNCTSAGDGFCDTPADPNLNNKVNEDCEYFGTNRDANGAAYTPLTNNMMAYTKFECRTSFTREQRLRIWYTYGYRQRRNYDDLKYKNKTPVVFYDQNSGLGQIWHFSGGELADNTYGSYWRKSWHSMVTFEEANQSHILLYDKNAGLIRMYDLTVRGKLGNKNYEQWGVSKDWDIVQAFETGARPYVLFYDRETGKVEIHIVSNGQLSGITYNRTWFTGWDMIRTFHHGNTPYAILYDRQTGRGWIYNMTYGRLGSRTHAGSGWNSGWDIIETFNEGNTPYAVFYDKDNGKSRIYNLSGGSLGTRTHDGTWQSKWDNMVAYHEHDQPYLIFYDDGVGHGKIYDVVNGRLNQVRTDSQGWLKNWKMIASY